MSGAVFATTKIILFFYLKFSFDWESCILAGNPARWVLLSLPLPRARRRVLKL